MSLPYYPLYPRDFEADTSHLTLEEDGAYNRLLRLCWMTPGCSLPDDDAWIMRRMRVDKDTFDRVVKVVLDEFFTRSDGRVSNARLARESEVSNERHKRRVTAGSKGGKSKALKTNKNTSSNAVAKLKQPEPEPYIEKEEPNGSSKKQSKQVRSRGSRLSGDWALPKDWGDWATGEGLDELSVRRQADRFKDYWIGKAGKDGVKLDWQATWRNWIRKAIDDAPKQNRTRSGVQDAGAFGKLREYS